MTGTGTAAEPAKFALRAMCPACVRHPTVPVRVFTEAARVLRQRLGSLPLEILNLPLLDVRCRETPKCKHNVPLLVGDLLGYDAP